MSAVVDDALNLVYQFVGPLCSEHNRSSIEHCLLSIAGMNDFTFAEPPMVFGSYDDVQSMLARINENESVRKRKGVYYTPTDVVRFIVANSIKASFGSLSAENIQSFEIPLGLVEDYCLQKSLFEPTCGAGEFLLEALNLKFILWDRARPSPDQSTVERMVGTIYGNDINNDSVIISKLRLFLCVANKYGVEFCVGLPPILNRNFTTNDYVLSPPNDGEYDIIVGNPPYVEDNKCGLELSERYGNIYVTSCYALCKKGLKKSLIHHEENFTAKLRGKIDVSRNIKQNSAKGRCDKFYCRYIDFTEDNIENRIIQAALMKCKAKIRRRFQEDSSIRKKMAFCLNAFRHVKDVSITNRDFNSAEIGGLYSYYKPLLQQARAILGFKFQTYEENPVESEDNPVYTIPYVINMETLFEYYARTVLKRTFSMDNYTVEKYSKKIFLQKDVLALSSAERGIHLMPYCIPDIIISRDDQPVLVVDAKYKMSGRPDRADSHQLLAYVLLTGAHRCAFVLPSTETKVREMKTTGDVFFNLVSGDVRYYEMLLGDGSDSAALKSVLD